MLKWIWRKTNYDDQLKRLKLAENGNANTVTKFSKDLGWSVPESTVKTSIPERPEDVENFTLTPTTVHIHLTP